jgi:hypothetical protein
MVSSRAETKGLAPTIGCHSSRVMNGLKAAMIRMKLVLSSSHCGPVGSALFVAAADPNLLAARSSDGGGRRSRSVVYRTYSGACSATMASAIFVTVS